MLKTRSPWAYGILFLGIVVLFGVSPLSSTSDAVQPEQTMTSAVVAPIESTRLLQAAPSVGCFSDLDCGLGGRCRAGQCTTYEQPDPNP